jgi:hypothetical protein
VPEEDVGMQLLSNHGLHVKLDSKQMVSNIQRQQSMAVAAPSVPSSVDTVKHIIHAKIAGPNTYPPASGDE